MLDPKILRKDTEAITKNLLKRGFVFDETLWNTLETKRKELQGFTEKQQSELNDISKSIGIAKKNSEDTSVLQDQASKLTSEITKADSNDIIFFIFPLFINILIRNYVLFLVLSQSR